MENKLKLIESKGLSHPNNLTENKTHIYSMGKTNLRRATHYLTSKQVEVLFDAGEKAYALGCPLNRFITIHYDDYATPKHPQKFIVSILEHSRKWLQRHGIPVAYIYVIEKGINKGIHVHLLIHIPAGFQVKYKAALRRWLPFEWSQSRINVKTIDYPPIRLLHPLNKIYGFLCYMCKGIDPAEPTRSIKPKYQGKIYGQRYGISILLK